MKNFFLRFLSFCFLVLLCANFFSEENSVSDDKEAWILAAQKFSLSENHEYSAAVKAATSVIPKLILEQISVDTTRTVFRDELLSQKLDSLLNERLSLFLELSREAKARDALVLKNCTMAEYQSALKKQEKKIEDVQKKIDENLQQQNNVLHPEQVKKRKEQKNLRRIFEPHSKKVALYNDSAESLFEPSENSKIEGIDSHTFAKEISSAKISGLITGTMTVYGNYFSASATLCVFPGAKKIASVTEVGSLNEVRSIAERMAFSFLPHIANGIPCEIEFQIYPEEAHSDAILTIDSVVYNPFPQRAILSSGVHSITVEADGFERESFLYDFSGRAKFLVEVNFQKESEGSVKLALSRFVPGEMFFGGKFVGVASATSFINIPLKVDGKTVFGYFEGTIKDKNAPLGERTETMFLMIPGKFMQNGNELESKMRVFDVSKNIDKRRKMMYIAYSSLLLALPFMFYSYGRFTTFQQSYVLGYGNTAFEDVERYRKLSFASIGIVAGCGAWFATELVLYLIAADKTLPPKAKKIKNRTKENMEFFKSREIIEAKLAAEKNANEKKDDLQKDENDFENDLP